MQKGLRWRSSAGDLLKSGPSLHRLVAWSPVGEDGSTVESKKLSSHVHIIHVPSMFFLLLILNSGHPWCRPVVLTCNAILVGCNQNHHNTAGPPGCYLVTAATTSAAPLGAVFHAVRSPRCLGEVYSIGELVENA